VPGTSARKSAAVHEDDQRPGRSSIIFGNKDLFVINSLSAEIISLILKSILSISGMGITDRF
ncbi:MAG: hypothetical protein WBV11_12035, partial [Salegentibacter sp.]